MATHAALSVDKLALVPAGGVEVMATAIWIEGVRGQRKRGGV